MKIRIPGARADEAPNAIDDSLDTQHGRTPFLSMPWFVAVPLPSILAVVVALSSWLSRRSHPLDPDAQSYLALASSFGWSSIIGGLRELLWVALLAIPTSVAGPVSDVPRLLGVLGFVSMVASFQLVTWKLYGPRWMLLAAALLASSPWLAFQASRGLREEASAAMLLMFALGTLGSERSAVRLIWLALVVGLAAMLRWDTILVTLPVLLAILIVRKFAPRHWAVTLAIVAFVVSPLVIGNWVKTGDPMYHSNYHGRFFRNAEFKDKPGFPTSEQIATDSFAGPSITWTGYLLGLHEPLRLVQLTLGGMARIPYVDAYNSVFYTGQPLSPGELTSISRYVKATLAALLALLAATGGLCLLLGDAWPIGAMMFLAIFEFSPIAEIMDSRLAVASTPFLLLGILELLAVITQRRRRERAVDRLRSLIRVTANRCAAFQKARELGTRS